MKNAYLAGYVDGDGCVYCRIYIQKPKNIRVYESSLQISSVDEDICPFFKKEFAGAVQKRTEKRINRRPSWLWYVKGEDCLRVLLGIEDFLVLKKKSASLCIALIQNINKSFSCRGKKISAECHSIRQEFVYQIKKEIHMSDRVDEDKFNSLKELKCSYTPSTADLAYFAGLIDAEGCFRIQHWVPNRKGRTETWVISLEIGNTKFPIFPWLIERFGGTVTYRKPTNNRANPMIIWSLRSDSLYQILPKIYPYLRVKKERCEKIGQFHQTNVPMGGDRQSASFRSKMCDLLVTRKKLFDEFQILNAKGNH